MGSGERFDDRVGGDRVDADCGTVVVDIGELSTPDWGPLEAALPESWLPWWMWMGCVRLRRAGTIVRVRVYKHRITRRSLHLMFDDTCRVVALEYPSWRIVDLADEVERVYEDIGLFNADREGYL